MMTPEEKLERTRQRMIEKADEKKIGTYVNKFVAPVFQRMIRAEAAAAPAGYTAAIVNGKLAQVFRRVGQCVCVTCGKVAPWSSGLGGIHTGHFLASRRFSILFAEKPSNVAPQCSRCNRYESGASERFRQWMMHARGHDAIELLERLKATTRQFSREELVDMRIEFQARLKAAENLIAENA